jgi:hypothetical protein
MNNDRFILWLILFSMVAVMLDIALVYGVDPFQVFHKPFHSGQLLSENQRYANAGLINSYLNDPQQGYDSAAFGTSTSVNFTDAAMQQSLGWKKTLRLFLPGGSPAEIRQTIARALSSGKIKHILLEVDLWSMNGEYRPVDNSSFPLYLYNDNRIDDLEYFVDYQVLWEAVKFLLGMADTRNGTPEQLGYWADGAWVEEQRKALNEPAHIGSLSAEHLTVEPWREQQIASLHYPAIENEIAPLLKSLCSSEVDVVLFIPPYSRLYLMEKQADLHTVIYEPRAILTHIANCPNIRLHAFDTLDFTTDLNNYKDHRHYLLPVSKRLLDWMGKREYTLSPDTIADYEQQWINFLNTTTISSTYPEVPHIP